MLQLVNDRKGEHAGEPPHRVHDAPPLHGLQHHFRIGVTPKTRSVRFELRPQVLEIVDLPVENDDVTTIVGPHRLVPVRRHVDHGKTSVPKRQAEPFVEPATGVVRTPMTDGAGHPAEDRPGRLVQTPARPETRDPAHGLAPRADAESGTPLAAHAL